MGRGRLVVLLEVGVTNGRDRERKQLQHQFSSYQLVTGSPPFAAIISVLQSKELN